jgi:hypothetical protein
MAKRQYPERPADDEYYEDERVPLFSQGDIFRDVPLGYPSPGVVYEDEELESGRTFLTGPLDFGPAMLITPTCSMRVQAEGGKYAHPVRTLVPLLAVDALLDAGHINESSVGLARKYDRLINYMYRPPLGRSELEFEVPETLALLYMPVTLHHDIIEGSRVSQLARGGAQQLHRKLVWFATGWLEEDLDFFQPPMD